MAVADLPLLARPALTELDDDALLQRCGDGDESAFSVLYTRVVDRVRAVCRRVLRDPSHAEEVAQEVLAEVWAKADRYDPERGRAVTWISVLARRRAVDRVRSEQASRDRDHRIGVRDRGRAFDVVADEVAIRLDHQEVRDAMGTLTDRQRQAVLLAYWDGHTYRGVAGRLGIPEGTAKSRLRDGLARLRADLDGAV